MHICIKHSNSTCLFSKSVEYADNNVKFCPSTNFGTYLYLRCGLKIPTWGAGRTGTNKYSMAGYSVFKKNKHKQKIFTINFSYKSNFIFYFATCLNAEILFKKTGIFKYGVIGISYANLFTKTEWCTYCFAGKNIIITL